MPTKPMSRTIIIAIVLFMAGWTGLSAQFSNTYYYMYGVPQANQLNPAFQSGCNGYLGLPVISALRFEVESTSLGYKDIFSYNSSTDKIITFMHPDGDKQKFLNALDNSNTIRAEIGTNIISLGWRQEDLFFTLDISERMNEGLTFTKDFAEFMIHGTKNQERFNFSGMGNDINYYHELALGASYIFDDEIQVGVRGKILLGVANLQSRKSDINLTTGIDEWNMKSRVEFNFTAPYLESLPIDEDGYLDLDSLGNMELSALFGFPSSVQEFLTPAGFTPVFGFRNPGFALDLGFNYRPIEQLNVSASIIDLGFIRWRNNPYQLTQTMDYTFGGIEVSLDEDADPGEELLDSLKNSLKIKAVQGPYTQWLSGKVYLGVAYDLTEKVRFGILARTRIYDYNFYNQFTLSANVQPISMFSASLSYSIYNGNYSNLGLGLSLRAGPLNVYFITDQAPSAYFWPQEFSSMNFRLGINIVWGCRKGPLALKDRPLID